MSRRPRRNHSAAFKAKVALEAVRGLKSLAELATQHDVQARDSIGRSLDFFHARRPDTAHKGQTPDQAYYARLLPIAEAA